MTGKNIIYFIAIIILVALNNNCYEYLTNDKVNAPQILFYRGLFTLVLIIIYALYRKEAIIPKKIKEQAIRFVTTGGSLSMVLFSFNYLSAGTVSLLQRMDIPVLIFFSLAIKKKKHWLQIGLSVLTVIIILFLTLDPELINEDRNGFLLVFGGIGLIAISYLTIHKGSTSESTPALINISSISCLFFGALLMVMYQYSWSISLKDAVVIMLSTVINIFLYHLTIIRYKKYSPEKALFPFVLAILSTSILEMIIEQKLYTLKEILTTTGLTLIISIICLTINKKDKSLPVQI